MDPLVTDHTFFSLYTLHSSFSSAKHDAFHNLFNTHLSHDFFISSALRLWLSTSLTGGTCYSLYSITPRYQISVFFCLTLKRSYRAYYLIKRDITYQTVFVRVN